MLCVNAINHVQKNRAGITRFADLNLHINRSEIVCILGKSGVGKSTLLKILSGLASPDVGDVTLDGNPVVQPESPVALVFQDYQNAVFRWLTVRDNLNLGRHKAKGVSVGHFDLEEVEVELGIGGLLDEYPSKLSGGQLQRVQIGRALMTDVDFLLLDEPDSSVDLEFKQDLQRVLIDLVTKKRIGVVFVSHAIDQAVFLAHRIYLLNRSKTIPSLVEVFECVGYRHQKKFVEATQDPKYLEIYRCVYNYLFEQD
jgi:NitT/TauT family transport system ATP-binding protein